MLIAAGSSLLRKDQLLSSRETILNFHIIIIKPHVSFKVLVVINHNNFSTGIIVLLVTAMASVIF